MFPKRVLLNGLLLAAISLFSVGCFTKKDEVAVEPATAVPPSEYPGSSPSAYPDATQTDVVSASGAPPAPASAPAPSSGFSTPFSLREGESLVDHQVESGDTLSGIATKYNTSISRIQAANGMSSTKIYAGRTIKVPTSAPPNLAMNQQAASTASSGGRYGAITPAPSGGSLSRRATTPSTGYPSSAPRVPSAPTVSAPSGSYPSATAPPTVPSVSAPPAYPGAPTGQVPSVPSTSSPASTSYPRVQTPPAPPAPPASTPAPTFGTPSFGSGDSIQFSN